MWILPLVASGVSGLFTALMGQQFIKRGKPHQLVWAIALLMYAVASFAAAMGMLGGWNAGWFLAYYYFGAIANVPVLAGGTIYLLLPRVAGHIYSVLVTVALIFAAGALLNSDLVGEALLTSGIPSASGVVDESVRSLSRYYSYTGFLIVVIGALASAFRLARRGGEALRRLALGNILIAVGVTINAAAGAFVRFGQGAVFAVLLLIGVVVMFFGFLRTRPLGASVAAAESFLEPSESAPQLLMDESVQAPEISGEVANADGTRSTSPSEAPESST